MSEHTKGPWAIEHWLSKTQNDSPIYIGVLRPGSSKVDEIVCTIDWDCAYTDESKEKRKANAKLIAAGPELLEALLDIVRDWDGEPEDMAAARAAIAKAS